MLRRIVMEYTEEAESLQKCLSPTTKLFIEFYRLLPLPEDSYHHTSESIERIAESFTQDLIFAITRGTFLILRHISLGLGLYNIVG